MGRVSRGNVPGERQHIFRISFLRLLILNIIWTHLGLAIVQLADGKPLPLNFYLGGLLFLFLPVSVLGASILAGYYYYIITDEGIGCYDFWGRFDFVRWADMVACKSYLVYRFFGVPSLKIFRTDARRPMYFPTVFSNREEFTSKLTELSPVGARIRPWFGLHDDVENHKDNSKP